MVAAKALRIVITLSWCIGFSVLLGTGIVATSRNNRSLFTSQRPHWTEVASEVATNSRQPYASTSGCRVPVIDLGRAEKPAPEDCGNQAQSVTCRAPATPVRRVVQRAVTLGMEKHSRDSAINIGALLFHKTRRKQPTPLAVFRGLMSYGCNRPSS